MPFSSNPENRCISGEGAMWIQSPVFWPVLTIAASVGCSRAPVGAAPDMRAPDMRSPTELCSDGVRDGDESDVDCGGACPLCPTGGSCMNDGDCESNQCVDGACAKSTVFQQVKGAVGVGAKDVALV